MKLFCRHHPDRGTIVILPGDQLLIGFPKDVRIDDWDLDDMLSKIRSAFTEGKALVFGFPVDVTDLRR